MVALVVHDKSMHICKNFIKHLFSIWE